MAGLTRRARTRQAGVRTKAKKAAGKSGKTGVLKKVRGDFKKIRQQKTDVDGEFGEI